jgi:hypothetical protein
LPEWWQRNFAKKTTQKNKKEKKVETKLKFEAELGID